MTEEEAKTEKKANNSHDHIELLEEVATAARKWASQEDYDGIQLLEALARLDGA